MIRNYIKIAFRNLKKDLLFSFINIFGLMIGLASFIIIALYVFDELTYDRHHKNADSIYRVVNNVVADGKTTRFDGSGYQISEKLKNDLPEIQNAARMTTLGRVNVSNLGNTNVYYEDFNIGNNGFLEIFDFKLLQGDPTIALKEPNTVIITQETAEKLYNTTEVLGETLLIETGELTLTITGVLKNFPKNSHISFNMMVSESTIFNNEAIGQLQNEWMRGRFRTYLLLDKNVDTGTLEAKINSIVAANQSDNYQRFYQLQPLKDVHFYSEDIEGNSGPKGNIYYVYVFSFIAIFVLLIACINYINLTTARYTRRAKEIAMRKVVGASRKSLVGQFLSEAYLLTLISLTLALLVIFFLLPSFNLFTGKELSLITPNDFRIPAGIAVVVVLVGFISGFYPALVLSASRPLSLLKNKLKAGGGNLSLRRSLVVFQFSLSIIMLIATMVVYKQMNYVDNKDMGFTKDQLVVIDINSGAIRNAAQSIKTEILKLAQVTDVTVSSRVPGEWKNIPKVKVKNSNIQNLTGNEMFFLGIDERFLPTYEMELLSGRNFKLASPADSSAVIINETAAKELGITEALEQLVELQTEQPFKARVIGIVQDFNFQSLKEPLAPMLLGYQNNPIQSIDYFSAKLVGGDVSTALDQMDKIMLSIDPENLFEYHFLDDQWELLYKEDLIRKTIFLILSILTIFIACLGLLGLVSFEAKQRIKEIGIRKVAGASVGNIVSLLSSDLLKLVFIAALISFPVAWFIMDKWLMDFAYRIDMPWWIFAIAGISALFIAFITMSFQAVNAAIANPVKCLRTE